MTETVEGVGLEVGPAVISGVAPFESHWLPDAPPSVTTQEK